MTTSGRTSTACWACALLPARCAGASARAHAVGDPAVFAARLRRSASMRAGWSSPRHHRRELATLIRLQGVRVPSLYGDSAAALYEARRAARPCSRATTRAFPRSSAAPTRSSTRRTRRASPPSSPRSSPTTTRAATSDHGPAERASSPGRDRHGNLGRASRPVTRHTPPAGRRRDDRPPAHRARRRSRRVGPASLRSESEPAAPRKFFEIDLPVEAPHTVDDPLLHATPHLGDERAPLGLRPLYRDRVPVRELALSHPHGRLDRGVPRRRRDARLLPQQPGVRPRVAPRRGRSVRARGRPGARAPRARRLPPERRAARAPRVADERARLRGRDRGDRPLRAPARARTTYYRDAWQPRVTAVPQLRKLEADVVRRGAAAAKRRLGLDPDAVPRVLVRSWRRRSERWASMHDAFAASHACARRAAHLLCGALAGGRTQPGDRGLVGPAMALGDRFTASHFADAATYDAWLVADVAVSSAPARAEGARTVLDCLANGVRRS